MDSLRGWSHGRAFMDSLKVVGPPPFGPGPAGRPLTGAATLWIEGNVLVTTPTIHALQVDLLSGMEPPAPAEGGAGADANAPRTCALLHLAPDHIGILLPRNDLAVSERADTLLQARFPKYRIRFVGVRSPGFLDFIKRRGDFWRVAPTPSTVAERRRFIQAALAPIACEPIFYYNPNTGTRFLTVDKLAGLSALAPRQRVLQLEEIRTFLGRPNAQGAPEIALWPHPCPAAERSLRTTEWGTLEAAGVEAALAGIVALHRAAAPVELQTDDAQIEPWRNAMFHSLSEEPCEACIEHPNTVLGPEFYRQVEWVPGVHFDGDEWVFDPLFDQADDAEAQRRCDWVARALVANVVREYADLDYINVGRIISPISGHPDKHGRRDVFLMEFKRLSVDREILKVVRFHKWGIREHLNEGLELLEAIMRSQEYADYIFNRRLGCRQLGMNLPDQVTLHHIPDEYRGSNRRFVGSPIWANYSERDFIPGMATNRIPDGKYSEKLYALQFAALFGHAAAINLIVGRVRAGTADEPAEVIFDQGDELVLHDQEGEPSSILVCDHSHSFGDYKSPLGVHLRDYARAVNHRAHLVPDPIAFAEEFLLAFRRAFRSTQEKYRRVIRAFDNLFLPQVPDHKGNFADRWQHVLRRLNSTSSDRLADQLRSHLVPLGGNP